MKYVNKLATADKKKKTTDNVTISCTEKLTYILKSVDNPTERISLRFLTPISIENSAHVCILPSSPFSTPSLLISDFFPPRRGHPGEVHVETLIV